MREKNSAMLVIATIVIILFTETVGINIQITFNDLPILFAIISILLLNFKLKEKITRKKVLIIDIVVIIINYVILGLLNVAFGVESILAVLFLYKFIDKFDFYKKENIIKNTVIYYILPLIGLMLLNKGYNTVSKTMSETSSFWMVNYILFSMQVIYRLIISEVFIIVLASLVNKKINSKIKMKIKPINILIIGVIVSIILLGVKITLTDAIKEESNDKISKLNNVITSNKLEEYYNLDLKPELIIDEKTMNDITKEEEKYMLSFNNILNKGENIWSEAAYKIKTRGVKELVTNKSVSKKRALQIYKEAAEEYVYRLVLYKENLSMQNTANIIIYMLNIVCICVLYKVVVNDK